MSIITRDYLMSGAYLASFTDTPQIKWWTRERIAASLADTLARRPDPDAPVWLFAYGSLIWNPAFLFAEQQRATLQGWRRSFCMRLLAGRGSPAHPGRMLALDDCQPATPATAPSHATHAATAPAPAASQPAPAMPAASTATIPGTPAASTTTRTTPAVVAASTPVVTAAAPAAGRFLPGSQPLPAGLQADHRPTHTTGIAYRLTEDQLQHELMLVWMREMIGGSYRPLWQDVLLADGRIVQTLVFVMNHACPSYERDAAIATVAPIIATATGHLGQNIDYLIALDDALRRHHIHDPYVSDLIDAVRVYACDI